MKLTSTVLFFYPLRYPSEWATFHTNRTQLCHSSTRAYLGGLSAFAKVVRNPVAVVCNMSIYNFLILVSPTGQDVCLYVPPCYFKRCVVLYPSSSRRVSYLLPKQNKLGASALQVCEEIELAATAHHSIHPTLLHIYSLRNFC